MLIFVACIAIAGVILSFVARYPALLVVMAVLAGVTILGSAQGWSHLPRLDSLPLTLALEILAIQVGYAVGVLGRSALGSRRGASRGTPEPKRPAVEPHLGQHNGG